MELTPSPSASFIENMQQEDAFAEPSCSRRGEIAIERPKQRTLVGRNGAVRGEKLGRRCLGT